tara:strand:+ start:666 stop:767 length:102 start_codon:yes stop_codon:yes gene_type:complete
MEFRTVRSAALAMGGHQAHIFNMIEKLGKNGPS